MIGLAAIGVFGGMIAGMIGVGGGVVFVPALVLLAGLDQHAAEATSLLAIIPVALVGAWRQDRYGNVQRRSALTMSAFAAAGAVAGVEVADALSGQALRYAFAALLLLISWRLVRTSLGRERGE